MTAHLYFFRPVQDSNPGLLAVNPVCYPSTTQPQDANLHESFVHVTYSTVVARSSSGGVAIRYMYFRWCT